MLLENKVVLITGASRGIGRATAVEAARQGANVALNTFRDDAVVFVREAFEQPFILDGQPYSASASIGVVVLGPATQSAEELLRNADTAMYRAKSAGKSGFVVFDEGMHQEALSREMVSAKTLAR